MSFVGQLYKLVFTGSFNGSENLELINAGDYTDGSRNLNTHNNGLEKRGGTQHVNVTAISANPGGLGGGQLIKQSTGTSHIYVAADDGKVYRNYVSILTGRSTAAKTHFTALDDKMFICNGFDGVQVDTGSAVAAITTPAADWTGAAQPTKIVVHGRGSSRRAFAFGVPGKEDTLYYSSLGNFEEFSGGTSGTIVVDVKDGFGIVDCISIDENLLIRTRNQDYWLADSDTNVANWGYFKTGWQGGAHSPRLSTHIYNDIYTMSSDGEVYSISRAEQLRNYRRASIARPFYIHNWIANNVDLTKIDDFHMSFDPKIQALKIWVVRQGQSEADVALVYYIQENRWAPPHDGYDNLNDSGYHAAASFQVNISGEDLLYTVDYNGFIWEMETVTKTDNGNGYTGVAVTGWLNFDSPGHDKRTKYGVLHFTSRGDYDLDIKWFADGVEQVTDTVTLEASGSALGSFILDTDTLGVLELTKREFDLQAVGEKFRFEIENNGAGEDFFLSHLIVAFVPLGHRRI